MWQTNFVGKQLKEHSMGDTKESVVSPSLTSGYLWELTPASRRPGIRFFSCWATGWAPRGTNMSVLVVKLWCLTLFLMTSLFSTCMLWRCMFRCGRRWFAFKGIFSRVVLSGGRVFPGSLGSLCVSLSMRVVWVSDTSVKWILPFWLSGGGATF